jgi:pSer/pThr/pTyr-binding forkhead associated (FHA) protein
VSDWLGPAVARIEELARAARLRDLDLFMRRGPEERLREIAAALGRLDAGAYLVGCGPYTQRLFRLSTPETIIGREATGCEQALPSAVDYLVNDCVAYRPREVSRLHAKITRQQAPRDGGEPAHVCGSWIHFVADLGSTCGTFLNGGTVADEPQPLADLDVISLGPSQVNLILFLTVPAGPG